MLCTKEVVTIIKFRKYLYIGLLIISGLLTAFTVIASALGNAGTESSIFNSVWVVFILAAFAALQIIGLFAVKPKIDIRTVGFYLLHIGLVLFLAGNFVFYLVGEKLNVAVRVDPTKSYNQIKRDGEDEFVNLGFDLGVADFKVDTYPAEGGAPPIDKYYEATLMISPADSREVKTIPLIVNKPYRTGGWKIFLMSYDKVTGDVVLMLKNDPAEYVGIAGVWMIIAGTVCMCLLKKRKAGDADE